MSNMFGMKRTTKSLLKSAAGAVLCLTVASTAVNAAGEEPEIPRLNWSFSGLFGHYDRAELQRGYQVYQEVCSACHGMKLLHYRNLSEAGGPEFPAATVEGFAANVEIKDGPNNDGEMFERPGKPADAFRSPYSNDNEARAVNGGALPPDLSVIAKARSVESHAAFPPLTWIKDVASGYQEGGPDYIYALLTGYGEAPADMEIVDGMSYNTAFPGHQIAMPSPIADGLVTYADGSPETTAQYSRDVTAFLMWAAEPHLEIRKRLGIQVLLYLGILALLLYLAKRRLWARLKH